MIETIVKVDGMMCGMCESHVNEAVRKAFPEVKRVSSSQAKAQTVIHSEHRSYFRGTVGEDKRFSELSL